MAQVKGDLTVRRTLIADRRVDQAAFTQALVADLALTRHSYAWYNLTSDAAYNVDLPAANTLPLGWSVVINNRDTSDTLTVRDNDATTIRAIIPSRAYRVTCVDNGSTAGVWHVDFLEESDTLPSTRFTASFNALGDWTGPVGGYYTRTIVAATHLRGVAPSVGVAELNGADFDSVILDNLKVLANGDVEMRVVDDARFAGRVIMI